MMAMFVYPYLAHYLFAKQPGAAGLFLGTAIHDTSQVMAAALSYNQVFGDELAMKVATMTKLTRNVFLVGVVPLLAYQSARRQGTERKHVNIGKLFPLFVLGFAALAVVRSLGDAGFNGHEGHAFGLWSSDTWKGITKTVGETISYGALGTAMAGVGLTTSLTTFRVLGLKPLYVGAMSATLVGGVALMLAALVGPRIDARLKPATANVVAVPATGASNGAPRAAATTAPAAVPAAGAEQPGAPAAAPALEDDGDADGAEAPSLDGTAGVQSAAPAASAKRPAHRHKSQKSSSAVRRHPRSRRHAPRPVG
jgi:hypothetical protein